MTRGGRGDRPVEPLLKPVIAPENLAVVRDQTGRAGQAEALGERAFGLQALLVGAVLRERERLYGIDADCVERGRERLEFTNRPAFGKFRAIDRAGESGATLTVERERNARGEETILREGVGRRKGRPSASQMRSMSRHM